MMTHQMLAYLRTLKRDGLVAGLEQQLTPRYACDEL